MLRVRHECCARNSHGTLASHSPSVALTLSAAAATMGLDAAWSETRALPIGHTEPRASVHGAVSGDSGGFSLYDRVLALSSSLPPSRSSGGPLRRPTLGLFLDWLEDDYQTAVLCGVADAAQRHDANVLCFAGGGLASPYCSGTCRNRVFQFAGRGNADALIVMAGSLGNQVGMDGVLSLINSFDGIPACSIAVPLGDKPSVLVDNARGMRDAIEHLIVTHGFRRIAFIRGPEANSEAERRFRVYCEVLRAHNIPYDSALVSVGDFHRPSGIDAVNQLLSERHQRFEAIVAASDYMALGAMDALETAGLRVPNDVAVVGFDDVDEARFASPALTTVRQPLYEQGLQAANMALAMLRGVHVEGQLTLHTELVIRHSCGCFSQTESQGVRSEPIPTFSSLRALMVDRRERILIELEHSLRGVSRSLSADWHYRLLEGFLHDLESGGSAAFIPALEDGLRGVETGGSDGSVWQDAISVLRRQLLPGITDHRIRLRAEDMCQQARLVVANVVERAQAQQRLEAERWVRILSETNEHLITAFDVVSLGRAVAEQLPRLGIQSCYLVLYTSLDGPNAEARLILAHDARRHIHERWTGTLFDPRDLLPQGLFPTERRTSFVVEPLFFQEHELGYLLLEMGPRQGIIYEALRDQISATVKGAVLVQEVVDKDRERERLMQDLERRATELEAAYTALKKNQEVLVSTEKMASIGRLTASIAHEMNTPVAAVRAALAELTRRVEEYGASVNDPEVTPEDHQEIVREMREALRLANSAAGRAADFVGSIKNQTRDTGRKERILFDLVASARESLLLLGHSLRRSNCRIEFQPSEEPMEILGTPGRFGQIVTNLVTNAIDAMVPLGGGVIEIGLVKQLGQVVLVVADRGQGIPPELLDRIWDPLFTTKPFGHGTGLGLTIVRDIVSADFGGQVSVLSRPEGGVSFTVVLPLQQARVAS